MINKKINNLLVNSKKVALTAMLLTAFNTPVKAYDERAYMTQNEQRTCQTCVKTPTLKQFARDSLILFGVVGGLLYLYGWKPRHQQKQK